MTVSGFIETFLSPSSACILYEQFFYHKHEKHQDCYSAQSRQKNRQQAQARSNPKFGRRNSVISKTPGSSGGSTSQKRCRRMEDSGSTSSGNKSERPFQKRAHLDHARCGCEGPGDDRCWRNNGIHKIIDPGDIVSPDFKDCSSGKCQKGWIGPDPRVAVRESQVPGKRGDAHCQEWDENPEAAGSAQTRAETDTEKNIHVSLRPLFSCAGEITP